jgi:hypothetical protein
LGVSWGLLGFLLFDALFLFSLIGASIRAYLSMKPEPTDGRILLWRLGLASCIVLIFSRPLLILPLEKPVSSEVSAISSLRTINTAQFIYAQDHPDKGFAVSLRDLGPSPGAELIDDVLASGLKNRYVIMMVATLPDSDGRSKNTP